MISQTFLFISLIILSLATVTYYIVREMQQRGVLEVRPHTLRSQTSESGQDLIEYLLMAGFVVVAGGATMPFLASITQTIFIAITQRINGEAVIIATSQSIPTDEWATTTRIVCAILAVLFLGLIVLRRREQQDDD